VDLKRWMRISSMRREKMNLILYVFPYYKIVSGADGGCRKMKRLCGKER
jgi:hypothetical protein